MILDKNGKLFGKVSIIDVLAIICVLFLGVGICARFVSNSAKNAKSTVGFEYVVEINGVRDFTVEALSKKGLLTDVKSKSIIGEITDVKSRPEEIQCVKADGTMVKAIVPDKYTVEVTVNAEGKESNNSYFVGEDVELSVGGTMTMTSKYANSTGRIIDVQKIY